MEPDMAVGMLKGLFDKEYFTHYKTPHCVWGCFVCTYLQRT